MPRYNLGSLHKKKFTAVHCSYTIMIIRQWLNCPPFLPSAPNSPRKVSPGQPAQHSSREPFVVPSEPNTPLGFCSLRCLWEVVGRLVWRPPKSHPRAKRESQMDLVNLGCFGCMPGSMVSHLLPRDCSSQHQNTAQVTHRVAHSAVKLV